MTDKQTVKFGDICKEVKLTTKDPVADGYERYIGLEHLDSGSLKIKRWGMIADDSPSFTRVFKKGQILLGKRRPYLKKAAIAEFDGICSGDIIVLEAIGQRIDASLLPFAIQSNRFWDWAIKTSSGSLSPRTKFSALRELDVVLPSNDEQKRIKEIIEKKEEVKRYAYDFLDSSEAFLRVLLQDFICTKSTEKSVKEFIPQGWSLRKLSEVAHYQLGKAFPSSEYCDAGIKLLRPGNLYSTGKVEWSVSDTTYLPEKYARENPNYIVNENEIVMNLTAQSLDDGFLGRVCMTQGEEECLLNQRLARITPLAGIDKGYLFWALQSRLSREYLHRMPVGTKVKHLYNFEIENIPVLVPNDELLQKSLASVLNRSASSIFSLRNKFNSLEGLSQLHDRIING